MRIQTGDRDYPQIFEAQKILKLLGMYPYNIDGIYGHGTTQAIMAFQKKHQLAVDGVMGKQTYQKLKEAEKGLNLEPPIASYEVEQLLSVYEDKGYQINEKPYQINMLGIRRDDIFDNMFSDRFVIFWKNGEMAWEKKEFEWTTLPGTKGQGGVFNPLTVAGMTGVAVLKEGQYLDTWRFYDTYTGWLRYPYFQQEKKVKIYRDSNRDTIVDYEMPEQEGWYGINIHRMSGNGQNQRYVNSTYVTWSLGCQGAPEPIFMEVVELARACAKTHGNLFTYTLIHKKDLPQSRGVEAPETYFTSALS